MANYNKVILVGNLTRDPQLSYLPSQTPVVDIGLAVNRQWTGQDGQKRDETCFIDARAYGKQAEVINHYMSKGQPMLIEGRLQFQQWQGQDGSKRSKHIVVVENFQFLGGPRSGGSEGPEAQVRPPVRGRRPAPAEPASQETPPPQDDVPPHMDLEQNRGGDDDIPF